MRRRSATIKDVARIAGVSSSTVSLAFNQPERVRPDTRRRILEVASRLQYKPSSVARRLVTRQANIVAVIVPNTRNPFFGKVVQGIERVASWEGFDLMLYASEDDPDQERRQLDAAVRNRADGVVLVGEHQAGPAPLDSLLAEIVAGGTMVMQIEREANGIPSVCADKQYGAAKAVEYLLALGHRRIAFVAGNLRRGRSHYRLQGYVEALARAGIARNDDWIGDADFTPGEANRVTRYLLEQDPELTAFFAANDLMAIGALRALHDAGRHVPDEVSVVGFDNIPESEFLLPALTTVDMPMERLGREAMECLIRLLRGERLLPEARVVPTQLLVRESCGPVAVHSRGVGRKHPIER